MSGRRGITQRHWIRRISGVRWRMSSGIQCGLVWRHALRSISGRARLWRADEEAFGERLAEAVRRSRPLGDEDFVDGLEKQCGRRLRARPVGRPKRAREEEGEQLTMGYGV